MTPGTFQSVSTPVLQCWRTPQERIRNCCLCNTEKQQNTITKKNCYFFFFSSSSPLVQSDKHSLFSCVIKSECSYSPVCVLLLLLLIGCDHKILLNINRNKKYKACKSTTTCCFALFWVIYNPFPLYSLKTPKHWNFKLTTVYIDYIYQIFFSSIRFLPEKLLN